MKIKLQDIVDEGIIKVAKEDPRQIIEAFFQIVDKDGRVVPFVLNEAQLEYYENMTARDDILKARKEGFSSLVLAILTVKFLFLENVNCVCISHEEESTLRLFEKVEYYIENMETSDGTPITIDLADKSRKRMKYKFYREVKDRDGNVILDKNGKPKTRAVTNTFYIGTAGSKSFGRGDTIHYLHMSEVAFWDNASRIMTGLMNAVPDNLDNTYIVKESTANGFGTQHHSAWVSEKEGNSLFKSHFFGWHKDHVNSISLGAYEKQRGHKFEQTGEEIKLAVKYNLSLEQLAWRRMKIASMQPNEMFTKEELFKQEFPIDDKEAFLSSGKPVFDPTLLEWYEEVHVRPPSKVGDIIGWDPPFFNESATGLVRIWEEPVANRQYVISADVAEKGDYSYATVVDRKTYEQVAEVNTHIDTFEFASLLYKLGMYYNKGLLAPERNNQGIAVVKKLDELRYPNMYVRESIDEITQKRHNELGWRTDSKTRPIMISDFNQAFTNRQYKIRSQLVIDQMRTFVRNKKGRPEAQANCHDDAVIGNCIAIQMYKFLPEPIKDDDIIAREYVPNNSYHNFLKNKNGKRRNG